MSHTGEIGVRVSCSSDKTVKVFDINSAAAVATYSDHEWKAV